MEEFKTLEDIIYKIERFINIATKTKSEFAKCFLHDCKGYFKCFHNFNGLNESYYYVEDYFTTLYAVRSRYNRIVIERSHDDFSQSYIKKFRNYSKDYKDIYSDHVYVISLTQNPEECTNEYPDNKFQICMFTYLKGTDKHIRNELRREKLALIEAIGNIDKNKSTLSKTPRL